MFIDARELAVNGIVKEVPESYDFGVMCLPNRPETEEDWADIREFALMIHETEQDAGPF